MPKGPESRGGHSSWETPKTLISSTTATGAVTDKRTRVSDDRGGNYKGEPLTRLLGNSRARARGKNDGKSPNAPIGRKQPTGGEEKHRGKIMDRPEQPRLKKKDGVPQPEQTTKKTFEALARN